VWSSVANSLASAVFFNVLDRTGLFQSDLTQLSAGFDQVMAELAKALVLLSSGADLFEDFVGNRPSGGFALDLASNDPIRAVARGVLLSAMTGRLAAFTEALKQ